MSDHDLSTGFASWDHLFNHRSASAAALYFLWHLGSLVVEGAVALSLAW